MNCRDNQKGFTVVELLIATTVFSIILLLCSMSIIQISNFYYKGIIAARTQETARTATDEISKALQFTGSNLVALTPVGLGGSFAGTAQGFCMDANRYSYVVDHQLAEANDPPNKRITHVFVVDEELACTSAVLPPPQQLGIGVSSDSRELLGLNMRLADDPMPAPIAAGSTLYKIKMNVAYGDSDLLEPASPVGYSCKSIYFGGRFCAVSKLNTIVEKRVK